MKKLNFFQILKKSFSTNFRQYLPKDYNESVLVGRVYLSNVNGPSLITIKEDKVFDLSKQLPTLTHLLNHPDPLSKMKEIHLYTR